MRSRICFRAAGILLFATIASASAQPIFQSSSGESSIIFPDGAVSSINFTDKSVKLAFAYSFDDNSSSIGLAAEGKSKDNLLKIFQDSTLVASEFDIMVNGTHEFSTQSVPIFDYVRIGVAAGISSTKSKQLPFRAGDSRAWFDTTYVGPAAGVRLNLGANSIGSAGHFLMLGIGLDYRQRTNTDRLDKRQASRLIRTDTTNTVSIFETVDALDGTFLAGKDLTASQDRLFSADLVWGIGWLDNRVSLAALYRWDGLYPDSRSTYGGGIFFSKEGSPLDVLGGLTFESVRGKFVIGLQTGYAFK
jgi:hypothetical protein